MQAPNSFKAAILKRMVLGFQLAAVSSSSLSLEERKDAIKLSANAAMASARGSRRWTWGLLTGLSKNDKDKELLRGLLGKEHGRLINTPCCNPWKVPRSKKIIRRCLRLCSRRKKEAAGTQRNVRSSLLARKLVLQRIQVLKRIVPGGDAMDGSCLLGETLDYAVSLKAQVEVMQWLLKASGALKSQDPRYHLYFNFQLIFD